MLKEMEYNWHNIQFHPNEVVEQNPEDVYPQRANTVFKQKQSLWFISLFTKCCHGAQCYINICCPRLLILPGTSRFKTQTPYMKYSQNKNFKDKLNVSALQKLFRRCSMLMKLQTSKIAVFSNKKKFTLEDLTLYLSPYNYPSLTVAVIHCLPCWECEWCQSCLFVRNIHTSKKYGELVGDQILGVTLHNEPIFKKNKKVLVFRPFGSGNARESL